MYVCRFGSKDRKSRYVVKKRGAFFVDRKETNHDFGIDISSVVKHEGTVLEVEKLFLKEVFSEIDPNFVMASDALLKGNITNLSGNLFLKGTFEFSLDLACDRCLKEFRQDFCVSVDEVIAKSGAGFEEDEYIPYSGSKVYLGEGLYKAAYPVVLERHLCKEDCKGLCTMCGCDLNVTECNCKNEEIDPRLEKLKEFFKN